MRSKWLQSNKSYHTVFDLFYSKTGLREKKGGELTKVSCNNIGMLLRLLQAVSKFNIKGQTTISTFHNKNQKARGGPRGGGYCRLKFLLGLISRSH
jgi:hypothetical protein